MRQHSFATLITLGDDGLVATHIPLLLDASRGPNGTIVGHLAKANPHGDALRDGRETLAIFQGPHAYISPSWYTTPMAVPTWNYVAVHAYGIPHLVDDDDRLYAIVRETVEVFERQFAYAWDLAARRDYAEKLLKNIVGFEFEITRLEGKAKLSQNRSRADQDRVIAGLLEQGDPVGLALAGLMRSRLAETTTTDASS
jgi:transcriptional regulator